MTLLFDHNLSPSLTHQLADAYPGCAHVRDFGLHEADDLAIWEFAIEHDYVIVSKDSDFHQLALLFGPPPKVVWIRRGNCTAEEICELLRTAVDPVMTFVRDEVAAFMILE